MPLSQARKTVFVEPGEILSGHPDRTGARPLEARQHHHQRGFAGARRPEHGDRFTGTDGQRDTTQDVDRPSGAGQCQAHVVERRQRAAVRERRSHWGLGGFKTAKVRRYGRARRRFQRALRRS